MKDFLVKIVSKFSGINNKELSDEEDKLSVEDFKSDLFDEDNQEFKIIGIFALVVIGILALIGILIFIFRKSIMEKFKMLGEAGAEVIDEFSSGDKNIFSTISDLGDNTVDCSKNYDATYTGEYLINNQKAYETLTLLNGGVYTKSNDATNVSVGNYTLNEKMLTLTETMYTGNPNSNLQYTISDDCRTLTRSLEDGTTVILNIK